jgi:hypothetical protein
MVLCAATRAAARARAWDQADAAAAGCAHTTASTAYRPPPRLREHVAARDKTCRFSTRGQPAGEPTSTTHCPGTKAASPAPAISAAAAEPTSKSSNCQAGACSSRAPASASGPPPPAAATRSDPTPTQSDARWPVTVRDAADSQSRRGTQLMQDKQTAGASAAVRGDGASRARLD